MKQAALGRSGLEAEGVKLLAFDGPGRARLNQQVAQVMDALQDVDDAPTSQLAAAFEQRSQALRDLMAAWPKAQAAAKLSVR